jgi:hypothetical protein
VLGASLGSGWVPGAGWLVLGGWLVGGWLVAGGWSFVRTACLSRSDLAMKARAGLWVLLWLQLLHAATVVASICHPTLDLFGHAPAPVPGLPLPVHIPPHPSTSLHLLSASCHFFSPIYPPFLHLPPWA